MFNSGLVSTDHETMSEEVVSSSSRGHPFSTYAKFSAKLLVFTPSYSHVHVHIMG